VSLRNGEYTPAVDDFWQIARELDDHVFRVAVYLALCHDDPDRPGEIDVRDLARATGLSFARTRDAVIQLVDLHRVAFTGTPFAHTARWIDRGTN
jgi:hypothetical protein